MPKIVITLPHTIEENEAKLFLAMKLFEIGKLSLEQAASLAGFTMRGFIEILGKFKLPVVDYAPEELEEDLKNA
ncbi:MAG: UPF0175 family protein [Thermodesulfobacterium sp.]|nr:UPF0175 family protein [Thermodesulfobacterium sp.]RLG10288.1 MAG: UPF0175 family protein [Candidatus Pacearchaeota archaeon]